MEKKTILGTMLISASLLGGASVTEASTSSIKPESKMVTVTYSKARLYTDSSLTKRSILKQGTVFKVDGYRMINGKHFYRVYQTSASGKKTYKGYLLDRDTKELKAEKASGHFIAKEDWDLWRNFYFNNSLKRLDKETVYFAKYKYTLGNGRTYYSMYQNVDGKNQWCGYINAKGTTPLTSTSVSEYVKINKDAQSYKNMSFTTKGTKYLMKYTNNFKAKRYYTLNGKKYYSVYRTAEAGEQWCGYISEDNLSELTAKSTKNKAVTPTKDYNIYSNHYMTVKGNLKDYAGKILTQKYEYIYNTGRKYASLYDGDQWIGYANVGGLEDAQNLLDNANEAISVAEKALEQDNSKEAKATLTKAINDTKDAVQGKDAKAIKDATATLNKVVNDYNKSAEDYANAQKDLASAKEAANTAISAAEKALEQDNSKEAKAALTKAINDTKDAVKGKDVKAIKEATSALNKAVTDYQKSAQTLAATKKAAQDAIAKANTALKGDGTASSKAKVKAALQAVEKAMAGTDVAAIQKATADLNKAVATLKPAASSADVTALQNAIKDAEQVLAHKVDLSNTGDVQKALDLAKDTLAAAKKNSATSEQVEKATQGVLTAIKEVKINTTALIQTIKEVKDLAGKVYMTKSGQDELTKAEQKAENASQQTSLTAENYQAVQEAEKQMQAAKEGLAAQPNQENGEALEKALKDAKALTQFITGQEQFEEAVAHKNGGILFSNFDELEKAAKAANSVMTALQKDKADHNTADQKYTAKDVKNATGALNQALNHLQINKGATEFYYSVVTNAINQIKCSNAEQVKVEAKKKLDALTQALKDYKTTADYKRVIDAAEDLQNYVNEHRPGPGHQDPCDTVAMTKAKADLNKALTEHDQLNEFLTGEGKNSNPDKNGKIIFANYAAVKTAADKAKEVNANVKAKASKNYTPKEVQTAADQLSKAMADLKVNDKTFVMFVNVEKQAINGIKCTDKDAVKKEANEKLQKLEETVKKDPFVKNYADIIKQAKDLQKLVNDHRPSPGHPNGAAHDNDAIKGTEGKTGRALVEAVQKELDENTQYDNEIAVKDLCKELIAYYDITGLKSGDEEVAVEGRNGLDNNKAMTDLYKDAPAAEKVLQDYAKNTKAVVKDELTKHIQQLATDLKGIRFTNTVIKEKIAQLEKLAAEKGYTDAKTKAKYTTVKEYCAAINTWINQEKNMSLENAGTLKKIAKSLDEALQEAKKAPNKNSEAEKIQSIPGTEKAKGYALVKQVKAYTETHPDAPKAKDVQGICKNLTTYYQLVGLGDEEGFNVDHTGEVVNNKALNDLMQDAPKAEKMLQEYAKNMTQGSEADFAAMNKKLNDDIQGLRKVPTSIPGVENLKGYALVKTVKTFAQTNENAKDYENLPTIEAICDELMLYYQLVGLGTEPGYDNDNTGKVVNNRALNELMQDAPEAEKLIQSYSKDTRSVKQRLLEEVKHNLEKDIRGLQKVPAEKVAKK